MDPVRRHAATRNQMRYDLNNDKRGWYIGANRFLKNILLQNDSVNASLFLQLGLISAFPFFGVPNLWHSAQKIPE